jgi:hypothetical protein
MFAAILLVVSLVAFFQFAIHYWRAMLTGVAAQPVSSRVLDSACVDGGRVTAKHFRVMAELHELTADLGPGSDGLGVVRAYYQGVRALNFLLGQPFPRLAAWSEKERTLCARYAAVQIDRRLQANLAMAAALRSC